MRTPIKTLLKPLSLALFVATTLPTQNACNQTSPSSNPPTQTAHTQTSPPFDTIFAIGPSPYFNPPTQNAHTQTSPPSDTIPAIGPSSHFCKAIGGKDYDWGESLIQTSDGGYAIAGYTNSFGAGDYDVYFVKLDAKGNLQWTKTIGQEGSEGGESLIQTADGGYAIAGYTNSFGAGETDVYVVKLDAHGNLQWTKTIGGPEIDLGHSLIQTADSGYAIVGKTNSFGAGDYDVYVVKLDAKGNLQWTKTIGGPDYESGTSLIQTSDGGYAIAGKTISFGAGETDVYVVKLDKNGNACCSVSQTSQVGSGGTLSSPAPSIGSGGKLTSPTSRTSSGGTLTNQCP